MHNRVHTLYPPFAETLSKFCRYFKDAVTFLKVWFGVAGATQKSQNCKYQDGEHQGVTLLIQTNFTSV